MVRNPTSATWWNLAENIGDSRGLNPVHLRVRSQPEPREHYGLFLPGRHSPSGSLTTSRNHLEKG